MTVHMSWQPMGHITSKLQSFEKNSEEDIRRFIYVSNVVNSEIYSKDMRRSGAPYFKHIYGMVDAAVEDGLRDVSTLIIKLTHDMKESAKKLKIKEENLDDIIDRLDLTEFEKMALNMIDDDGSNKIGQLDSLYRFCLLNSDYRTFVAKVYDNNNSSTVDASFMNRNGILTKQQQNNRLFTYTNDLSHMDLENIHFEKNKFSSLKQALQQRISATSLILPFVMGSNHVVRDQSDYTKAMCESFVPNSTHTKHF